MLEFPVVTRDQVTEEQRPLWNELTCGPRGFYTGGPDTERLPDLYNAWMQFPAFGEVMLRLADQIRDDSRLSGKFRELVVLTSSALLGARVEFDFHVPFARAQGLSEAVIAAIGNNAIPDFDDEDEKVIYDVNASLLKDGRVDEDTYAKAVKLIGFPGLMQLVATITLYVATAYTINLAKVKLADDFSVDPGKLERFFAGEG